MPFLPDFSVHLCSATRLMAALFCAVQLCACALAPHQDDGITKQAASLAGIATPTTEPAPFIKEQRPAGEQTYLPVGVTPPVRAEAPRAPAAVTALEAELNAQRDKSRAFATRPPPKPTYDGSAPPKVEKPPPELMPQ
jgi:hypothetical protein